MLLPLALCVFLRVLGAPDGTELAGGSQATLEWRAETPLPPGVEEWEAFLSVDGGRYYAVRLTPHLDRDLRRFTFTVPNVDSRDARILLRFGDERRETEVEIPLRFSIRHDGLAPRAWAVEEEEEGESAREGEEPVAAWEAGERDGSGLHHVEHRDPSLTTRHLEGIAVPLVSESEEAQEDDLEAPAVNPREIVQTAAVPAPREIVRLHDPLLDTMRLNI